VIFLGSGVSNLFFFMDGIGYPFLYGIKYGYALSILTTAMVNIGLAFFATEVFSGQKEATIRRIKVLRVSFIIIESVICVWGSILKMVDSPVTEVLMLIFIVSVALYLILGFKSLQLARRVEGADYKRALKYISIFAFCILGVFIFYILDSFYSGYSTWSFLGTAMYLLTMILGYLGFVKPSKKKQA
jgi:hypothetical protein